MVMHLTDKKISKTLLIAGTLLYLLVYVGRYSFNSQISYLVNDGILTKPQSGLIGSLFYLIYAVGQVVFGLTGDKRSPYKVILLGTSISAAATFLMFFCKEYVVMLVVYGISALGQSMLFPAFVVLFSTNLIEKHRAKGLNLFALSSVGALLATNLFVVVLDAIVGYSYVYILSGLLLMGAALYWFVFSKKAEANLVPAVCSLNAHGVNEDKEKSEKVEGIKPISLLWMSGIAILLVSIICRGLIDNGTATWIPTMIMETYDTTPTFSLFLTTFLPLGNILGAYFCSFVLSKTKCEMKTTISMFALMLLPFIGLLFMKNISVYISGILLFFIYVFKFGLFKMLNVSMPAKFGEIGKASFVTSIMNCASAVGFMLAGYLFGFVAESYGWTAIIILWTAIIVIAIIFCLLSFKKWKAFLREHNI